MRNPFDRLVSWYSHLVGDPNEQDAGILFPRDGDAQATAQLADLAARHESIGAQVRSAVRRLAGDFATFARLPASTEGGLFARFHVNQVDYLTLDGALAMDYVLRFETLATDFAQLAAAIGLAGQLPHRNRSARTVDYAAYYDPDTRALIAARCQPDCVAFGYRFAGGPPGDSL